MRLSGLALAASFMLAAVAAAQQAPPQLPAGSAPAAPTIQAPPSNPELDGYLEHWEKEMKSFRTLALKLTRIDEDKVLRGVTQYEGIAYFMKTGSGASARNLILLQTSPKGSNELAEKFVCSGTFLYYFDRSAREVQARELPKSRPGAMPDDNFLGMFGLQADEAKRRYSLTLTKADANFIYIDILPRFARDKEDFEKAQIVLNKSNFMPRRLWYRQPNKTEVSWDIVNATVNGNMNQRWFDKPETPPGWKFRTIPPDADAMPRTIRNSSAP
jgi:TIGR03009 family protein